MNHKLRSPLSVVESGLKLLGLVPFVNHDTNDLIADMQSACSATFEILDDSLAYEDLQSSAFQLKLTHSNLADLVKCTSFEMTTYASNLGVHLRADNVQTEKIALVNADSCYICFVIRHLIKNALKFTPDGCSVVMALSLDTVTQRVRLEVQDSGPGIAREDRQKLFNEVVQFNAKELQGGQGSGLGLFLSQRIIAMHDGVIGVDLEWEGVGSKFYLELPLITVLPDSIKGHRSSFFIVVYD